MIFSESSRPDVCRNTLFGVRNLALVEEPSAENRSHPVGSQSALQCVCTYAPRTARVVLAQSKVRLAVVKYRLVCAQIILTEEFDEGMMVMRRLLGWEMIDMTYSSMYETKKGEKRFDGMTLVDVPHFDDLPQEVRASRTATTTRVECVLSLIHI